MDYMNIGYATNEGVATIELTHAPGNTLSMDTLSELTAAFGEIRNDSALRAVILTGAGERAFSAGADIRELRSIDAVDFAERGQVLFRHIETFPKPVIAAVNGMALGGGCELAMSCHLRIASEHARFGQLEINYGMIPSWGGTQRLVRLIGRTRALEMLLTGQTVTASRAEQYGLVNAVVPAAELKDAAQALAQRFVTAPPQAIRAILECVDAGLSEGLQKGLDAERDSFHWVYRTEDAQAGLRAFFAKQKPKFTGQ